LGLRFTVFFVRACQKETKKQIKNKENKLNEEEEVVEEEEEEGEIQVVTPYDSLLETNAAQGYGYGQHLAKGGSHRMALALLEADVFFDNQPQAFFFLFLLLLKPQRTIKDMMHIVPPTMLLAIAA